MKRRKFLRKSSVLGLGLASSPLLYGCINKEESDQTAVPNSAEFTSGPIVISTWTVQQANEAAWKELVAGRSALDAVEMGCREEEANAEGQSVGKGGLPDRDGNVTLDACIMNQYGDCGSVVYLKNIMHAVSVARKVMEETPHVMLAGDGAEQFALANGFEKENLLTEASKEAWEEWKVTSEYKPIINIENHDTIGMLALDKDGNLSGACTTSGLAYKMAGRIGDSPIIGSGLYVDNEIGAAVATGLGEEVVKTVGSFLIVELMRQGKSPQEACEEAIKRIVNKPKSNFQDFQVAYIAINKKGETGSFCIHEGFTMTKSQNGTHKVIPSNHFVVS